MTSGRMKYLFSVAFTIKIVQNFDRQESLTMWTWLQDFFKSQIIKSQMVHERKNGQQRWKRTIFWRYKEKKNLSDSISRKWPNLFPVLCSLPTGLWMLRDSPNFMISTTKVWLRPTKRLQQNRKKINRRRLLVAENRRSKLLQLWSSTLVPRPAQNSDNTFFSFTTTNRKENLQIHSNKRQFCTLVFSSYFDASIVFFLEFKASSFPLQILVALCFAVSRPL